MLTLTEIEAKLKEFNPKAIAADVTALESRLANAESTIAQLAPAIQGLLTIITPLLPPGTQIPAEITSLLVVLSKSTT